LRAQHGGRHGVEVAAADYTVVEGLTVSGEGDSIGAEGGGCDGLAHARVVVGGHTPDLEEEAGFWAPGFDVVEVVPGGAVAEVDDRDTVAAFGGVGDVGYLFSGEEEGGAEIEAHVVEVGIWEGDDFREEDCGEDSVVGKVDADEFGAPKAGRRQSATGERGTAGVENPKSVSRVYNDALDAGKAFGVANAGRVRSWLGSGIVDATC
jgi:hypothetical protein